MCKKNCTKCTASIRFENDLNGMERAMLLRIDGIFRFDAKRGSGVVVLFVDGLKKKKKVSLIVLGT